MKKIGILFVGFLLMTIPIKVHAADTPAIGGKMDRGVSRVSTYIGEGATSFQTLIVRAADNWTSPGWASDVGFAYAPNSKGTMLDIYCYSKSYFGGNMRANAETTWYDINGKMIAWPRSGTYRYAKIVGNTDSLNTLAINVRTAVFAHEMGHAFGLDHNDATTNSIMYGEATKRALKVQKIDTNTVNRLY